MPLKPKASSKAIVAFLTCPSVPELFLRVIQPRSDIERGRRRAQSKMAAALDAKRVESPATLTQF